MNATLYNTHNQVVVEDTDGLRVPEVAAFVHVQEKVATLLGCALNLVDVLASGEGYVVYSVFDSEEAANPNATSAVAALTGASFNIDNEDELLRGPVLVVRSSS